MRQRAERSAAEWGRPLTSSRLLRCPSSLVGFSAVELSLAATDEVGRLLQAHAQALGGGADSLHPPPPFFVPRERLLLRVGWREWTEAREAWQPLLPLVAELTVDLQGAEDDGLDEELRGLSDALQQIQQVLASPPTSHLSFPPLPSSPVRPPPSTTSLRLTRHC